MPAATDYKALLDSLTTAVLIVERNLCVHYLNPAAEVLLETSLSHTRGSGLFHLLLETGQVQDTLQAVLQTGQSYTRREAELLLPGGNQLTVDYSVSPVGPEASRILMEIQPRDHLLRISREEDLLSQQETTRTLVRGMAHEIKNPLGGIRGAAQLLERELTDEGQKEYTRVIMAEADRLRSLVDRMLGPGRAPRIALINIHEVLERVKTLLEAESRGRLLFQRDYDPSIPEFPGDREQLIQAFLNIARNGMEAIFESRQINGLPEQPLLTFRTRTLRQLTIAQKRHRLVCRVEITDNGPGIPPELLHHIFYPMISGRASGTGLGLSITQSIIGQHRGLVECQSQPGRTDFIIYLPLEDAP